MVFVTAGARSLKAQTVDQVDAEMPLAAPLSPAAAASTPPADWSADYRLGPGDLLDIQVFEAEEYSGQAIVLQDGSVNLPRVGKVLVQGYTLQQATAAIAARYAPYIRNPIVSIQPVRFRPVRVGIAGEVKRPGSYVISGVSSVNQSNVQDSRFPTLTQAIAEAGGITAEADLRQVELRRQIGPDQEQVLRINLWDLIQSGDLDQDVVLLSGDEVVIPTAIALTPQESTELASASFAPETIKVYVAGEVEDPGVVQIPLNSPLNQALLAAGSFNRRAERETVELVRVNPDGTASQQRLTVDFTAGVNDPNNPILKDQDVVVVNRSGVARVGDVTDILLSPVTRVLNTILGLQRLFD